MKRSFCLFLLLLILSGCSSGGFPVVPDQNQSGSDIQSMPSNDSGHNPDGDQSIGYGALGFFSLTLDPDNFTAELVPIRTEAAVDALEAVDITNFMELTPCTDCVKIKSLSLDSDSNLVVSIGIRHPFRVGDQYKPITGTNRADLHVFNVEGIVFADTAGIEFEGVNQKSPASFLLNADGYTNYLDTSCDAIFPTDATVHPYILHFDDYSQGNYDPSNQYGFQSVTTPPPSGNLVMPMGSDYDFKDYVFDIDGSMDFMFAVGCTYPIAVTLKALRFNPQYRVPQHNKKAASEVDVLLLNNQLKAGTTGSGADIEIHVVDISQGVEVGEALNQMFADSSVDNITLEIPGILLNPITIEGSESISGSGHDPSDPLVYTKSITNELGASAGPYYGIVKVLDNYPVGLNTYTPITGYDGISRVDPGVIPTDGVFTISEFATYQVFTIDVAFTCGPITGTILTPNPCPANLENGDTVDFTVSASSANGGGNIVLYEVDYDYDGVTFNTDNSNTDGIFNGAGPFNVPDPCIDNIPHSFTVAFRATDECIPPNVTVFASCDVIVTECFEQGSVGNVWITVNRIPVYYVSVYHVGDKFDPAGEWTLHWDAVPGAVEYAIYFDNDPGDFSSPAWTEELLTDNLGSSPLGTTSETFYTVPVGHVPANRYVVGNTYIVRARSVAGDQSSESSNSEPAFIMANGWETTPSQAPVMDPTVFEGWLAGWETANVPGTWYEYPTTDNFYQNMLDGVVNVRISSCLIGDMTRVGTYTSMVKRTPTVPNAPVRFLDFPLQAWNSNNTNPLVGGVIIGTCSIQPGTSWSTPIDFHWAKASNEAPFVGYNNDQDEFLLTLFDGVDTTEPWCFKALSFYAEPIITGMRIGGDVNLTADPNDPYVGFAAAKEAYTLWDHDNWFSDDLAIMIY
jgi:hypothetical protein